MEEKNEYEGCGIIARTTNPWWYRVWVLVTNPVYYVFKGVSRW